jgi:hypothetical protein
VGMFAAYFTEFRKFMQPPKDSVKKTGDSLPLSS